MGWVSAPGQDLVLDTAPWGFQLRGMAQLEMGCDTPAGTQAPRQHRATMARLRLMAPAIRGSQGHTGGTRVS